MGFFKITHHTLSPKTVVYTSPDRDGFIDLMDKLGVDEKWWMGRGSGVRVLNGGTSVEWEWVDEHQSDSVPVLTDETPKPEITVTPGRADQPHYPNVDSHTWGEFAYLAIEAGGYSDLTAVSPYTGARLHTFACRTGGTLAGEWIADPYQCLRNLIDAMESVGFLTPNSVVPATDDDSPVCGGHESLRGDSMGTSVYCDGSCVD